MREQSAFLKEVLHDLGISCSEREMEQFLGYYDLLVKKNEVMNLTRITDWKDAAVKHFADSLSVLSHLSFSEADRILDLGTGAGFPGIPLSIHFPEKHFFLADSVAKKLKFIEEACVSLTIQNVQTIHGRAEDLGQEAQYRESFDLVLSRAVASLPVLAEYCLPFVRIGGSFAAYKTEGAREEVSAAKRAITLLGGKIRKAVTFDLSENGPSRQLIIIEKTGSTSKKYPRKAGTPSKEPL